MGHHLGTAEGYAMRLSIVALPCGDCPFRMCASQKERRIGGFWMRRFWGRVLSSLGGCLILSTAAWAGRVNPADFPLRVHIVARNGFRHYYRSALDAVDGMGVADLFENGQPLGFNFTYNCGQPITPQTAYETYMARWKKQGRSIEILEPVIGGKPGEMNSCELKVTMKQDTVYIRHNGGVAEEPAARFKEWMVKHEYDPEHGKDEPVNLSAGQPAPAVAPAQ